MRHRYVPRRSSYRRAPVPPPPPVAHPPVYGEVVEESRVDPYATGPFVGDPFDPGPRPEVAPWARNVWFWLLLLGVVAIVVVALVLATQSS
jgi:hypothetical protein